MATTKPMADEREAELRQRFRRNFNSDSYLSDNETEELWTELDRLQAENEELRQQLRTPQPHAATDTEKALNRLSQ